MGTSTKKSTSHKMWHNMDVILHSSASSSSENQDTKACCTCHKELPVDQFHKCKAAKDGLQWFCKSCNIAAQLRWARNNRVVGPVDNDNLVEDPSDVVDDLMIVEELTPDSLYIMENPRIPGEVKIGRSKNPEERARQLSNGHPFTVVVRRSYERKGFLEKTLHQRLKRRRVEEGPGVEWFKVSVEQAGVLIEAAILEDELART